MNTLLLITKPLAAIGAERKELLLPLADEVVLLEEGTVNDAPALAVVVGSGVMVKSVGAEGYGYPELVKAIERNERVITL